MPDSKRQLAAIMFTDIVGYTRLMGKDSQKALDLVRINLEIQKPIVEKHEGQWIKEIGDGTLCKFNTALDAVICAIEIQKYARAELDAKLRIGIHLGDITIENNDVFGDGVNIASRIEAIADPGGIYISESVEKAIRGQADIQVRYLGGLKLKNVSYDLGTYALQGVGLPAPDIRAKEKLAGRLQAEIQRRGVFRAGVTYLIVVILLLLLHYELQPIIGIPKSITILMVTVLIIGFPVSLLLAWKYERSPEGFVRTTSKESWQNPYPMRKRKPLTGTIIISILIFATLFLYIYPRYFSASNELSPYTSSPDTGNMDKSIAVLPFRNDSPDKENEYVCTGMMEEIINDLQKIEELSVASRTSVERYRDTDMDIKTIGDELKVAYLIEGSVRKSGDELRIHAQLIDAKSGNHLWSEGYDGKYSERIFEFERQIASQIVSSLKLTISPEVQQRMENQPTENVLAWDLFQRGLNEIEKYVMERDKKDNIHLTLARSFFRRALEIDPGYSRAYFGLGDTYYVVRKFDSAIYFADKAIASDPNDEYGYRLKGQVYMDTGDADLAIEYLSKAYELAPGHNMVNMGLGITYLYQKNDIEKGFYYLSRASKLKGWGSQIIYANVAAALSYIGYYEKAEQYYRILISSQFQCNFLPFFIYDLQVQGRAHDARNLLDSLCVKQSCEQFCARLNFHYYYINKDFERAEASFKNYLKLIENGVSPIWPDSSYFIIMFKRLGQEEQLLKITDKFHEHEKNLPPENTAQQTENTAQQTYLNLSTLYTLEGNSEKAIEYLSKAVELGFVHEAIEISRIADAYPEDPEFQAILKQNREEKAAARARVKAMEAKGEIEL